MAKKPAKRILVTGATGFIGQALVAAAVRAGYVVRVAIRREVSFAPSVEVKLISDLRNKIEWDPILQDVDIVVHAAGLAHADQTDDAFGQFDQINWLATARLTAAAKAANIKRFVYISSVRAQIGPTASHIIRESDFPMPTDYYGRSKLAAETAIKAANISYTILRPVVVYGPHAKGNIHTLGRVAALPFPLPFKDFIHRRSLVALDNLVAAILFVLENEKAANETFLVAGPRSLTLAEFIAILRKSQGRKPWLFYFPKAAIRFAMRLAAPTWWERLSGELVVSTHKLKSIGWKPPTDTYSGLAQLMDSFS